MLRLSVLAASQPDVVFQAIVDLASGDPLGYEALARFAVDPYRLPSLWMIEAAAVGLGVELEASIWARRWTSCAPPGTAWPSTTAAATPG